MPFVSLVIKSSGPIRGWRQQAVRPQLRIIVDGSQLTACGKVMTESQLS
jgi:hypothetical protein